MIEDYLNSKKQTLTTYMDQVFSNHPAPRRLLVAMKYSLAAGGKRLRPILCLAAAEAAGGNEKNALDAALALECIHTYSLIHDDLPCMDDDDLRRGQPTNHKAFDEATAVLAGDALLTEAFSLLSKTESNLPADVRLVIIERIARGAGSLGMVGGQMLDMQGSSTTTTIEGLQEIHAMKTGWLLTVSVEAGALAAGVAKSELAPYSNYGENLGFAFQVVDDVLDVTAGSELGKSQKSDIDNDKATYVAILGLEKSKALAAKHIDQAKAAIEPLGDDGKHLRDLADFVLTRSF